MNILKKYQEITIINENSEISKPFIFEKLYQQLHLALATIQNSDAIVPVGVSFPEYKKELITEQDEKQKRDIGSKLRLFAQDEYVLNHLNISKSLSRLKDYVCFSSIRNVPLKQVAGYEIYNRKQSPKNIDTLARRKIKRARDRNNIIITHEEALQELNKNKPYNPEMYNLPFIIVNSLSSNQRFPIFIEQNIVNEENYIGFNSYGLSGVSTVPKF